ncbi:MAG TPA: PilZ domain-containing protein [Thermodesulfovibrionales bacterium]|nr:PilZ domain-containing protein [Thermodesulfovibrionales bacterium]
MFESTLTSVLSLGVAAALICASVVLFLLRSEEKRKDNRLYRRFDVKCRVEFTANGTANEGITQDISLNGLSIRTEHQFDPDTTLDIGLWLPGNKTSKLKGKVIRTIKNDLIGVTIISKDSAYLQYYKYLEGMGSEVNR